MVAIPDTKRIERLEENAAADIALTPADLGGVETGTRHDIVVAG